MEPQTPPIPPTSPVPQVKNSLVLIISVLLMVTVTIAGLFYFQIQKLSKELSKYQVQTSPTPTATPDPTADWKTYTNKNFSFSVKYNPSFNPNEVAGSVQQLALISFGSMKNNGFDIEVSTGDRTDYYKNQITDQGEKIDNEEKILVDGITATKLTYKQIIVIDKFDVSKVIVTKNNRDYIITALASDINQILSTFKFVDKLDK